MAGQQPTIWSGPIPGGATTKTQHFHGLKEPPEHVKSKITPLTYSLKHGSTQVVVRVYGADKVEPEGKQCCRHTLGDRLEC